MKRVILFLFAIMFLFGCMTTGKKINMDNVKKIKVGVSTTSDVVSLLGKPQQITENSDGDIIFEYKYSRSTVKAQTLIPIVGGFVGGVNTQNQTVKIVFDKNGVVKEIYKSYGSDEMKQNLEAGTGAKNPDITESR